MTMMLSFQSNNGKEIPPGGYLICLVRKATWKRLLFAAISIIFPLGNEESVYHYWLIIMNSEQLLNVSSLDVDHSPKEWFEHYRDNLSSMSNEELKEIYFSEDPELLTQTYKDLVNLKWYKSCFISIGGNR